MKVLLLLTTLGLISCGSKHQVGGSTYHRTDNNVKVEILLATCDDPKFTAVQKLKCIKWLTHPHATGTIEGMDNLDELTENE